MKTIRRTIHPEVKILDGQNGIAEYIASDESLDSYNEVIRANGWRFDRFAKNAPFVDSHDYSCIEKQLGKVIDFKVAGGKLVETVQWAIDVPENQMARLGWNMARGGYLKAVSVGFLPTRMCCRWDNDKTLWQQQLKDLNMHEEDGVRAIYVEQQQIELSAVIIGANPNAVELTAKAFKAGVLTESDIQFLSKQLVRRENSPPAPGPGQADEARDQARQRFLDEIQNIISKL